MECMQLLVLVRDPGFGAGDGQGLIPFPLLRNRDQRWGSGFENLTPPKREN